MDNPVIQSIAQKHQKSAAQVGGYPLGWEGPSLLTAGAMRGHERMPRCGPAGDK